MTTLDAAWRAWRKRRRRELAASGMAPALAHIFARQEALGRARLAQVLGRDVAETAPLRRLTDEKGDARFVLVGAWEDLPPQAWPFVEPAPSRTH